MADEVILETPEVEEVEQEQVEPLEVEEAEETPEEGVEGEESGEEEPAEEEGKEEAAPVAQDGRKMPDAFKKGLAALKTSNPEAAKLMRAQWFQNQDYRAAYATPAEAVAVKQQWDEIGGAEGVQEIQAEREQWADVDRAVGEGKAADLIKDDAELLSKNTVGFVNAWAEKQPEQYKYYTNTVTANGIQSLGLQAGLQQLHAYLKDKDPEAAAFVAREHDKIVDLREQTAQYEQKRTDPREEALKQKEQGFEEKRRADFEGQVATESENYLVTAVDKAIGSLLNGRKVDDDTMAIYREKVTSEVQKRLAQVPNFDASLEAQYRTGDRGKSVSYVKSQYDRILGLGKAANVIDPLLRTLNPAKPAPKPASKVTATGEPGTITLPDLPEWNQVDWSRTSSQEYAQGFGILTNGKKFRCS